MSVSGQPLPRTPLKVVLVSAILVAWEPGVLVKGFPLGLGLQLLGLVAALAAGWRLRDHLPPPWLGAQGALLLWGGSQGLLALLPGLASYRAAFDLLALVGFLLAVHALRERARSRGHTLAFACWTHAGVGGAVGLGLPIAAGLVTLALHATGIETPDVFRHHPAAVILLHLMVAAPIVLFVRAMGWTLREEADAANAKEGWLGPAATHLAGAVVLLLLLLTPVWLLLPAWRHFAATPTFAAYLKQVSGGRRGSAARTQVLSEGKVVPIPEEGPLPAGLFDAACVIELELKHGDESLLWLEHELVVTLDTKQGAIVGREAGIRGLSWDPRFSLVGASRVLKSPIAIGPEDAPTALRLPFELTAELSSAVRPARFDVRLVEAVPPPVGDPDQADMIAQALGLPRKRSEPWLRVPAFAPLEAPPPASEGLRYAWQVRGWIELLPPAKDKPGAGWQARLLDEVVFTPNSQAYSYMTQTRSTLRSLAGTNRVTHTTRRRSSKRLRWNGKVW